MRGRALMLLLPAAVLRLGAQDAPPERPIVLDVPRASIVVLDPVAAATVDDDRFMSALIARCQAQVRMGAADSARIMSTRVLASPTARDGTSWPLVFVAAERDAPSLPCAKPELVRLIAAARGLTLSPESAAAGFTQPTRIALVRNDLLVAGQERLSGPGLVLTPGGLQPSPHDRVGMAFDLAVLAPTPQGLPLDLRLAVWTGQSENPQLHTLPPAVLQALWDRATPTRLDASRLRAADADLLRFALPRPRDGALAEAHRLHAAAEYGAAVPAAVTGLRAAGLRRDDRLSARMQLGLTALAVGDTAVALVHFEQAKRAEPCVRLASDAPTSAQRLLDGLPTPPRDCRPSSVAGTLLRGMALPGFGHRASDRWPLVGALSVAAIGGVALAAVQQDRAATEKYRTYLRIIPSANDHPGGAARAIQAYDRAESARVASVRLGQAAAVLWGLSVVDAFLGERRFRTRLAAVQQYGGVGLSLWVF